MTNKRFLVPVLAFVAFGWPAWAQQEYCSSTSANCSTNSQTAFNNAVSADDPAGVLGFSNSLGVLSNDTYTDDRTSVVFVDYLGGSPNGALSYSYSGSALTSPEISGNAYTIQITIPADYLAIALDIDVPRGLCDNYCPEGQTAGFVAFINTGDPSLPWTVNVSPLAGGFMTEIVNFDAYGPADMSPTPEIGTLLLIGFGLIAMRWMKRARAPRRRLLRTLQTA